MTSLEYSYYHITQMLDETERLVLESRNDTELDIRLAGYWKWLMRHKKATLTL
jgi:hypothetical protein